MSGSTKDRAAELAISIADECCNQDAHISEWSEIRTVAERFIRQRESEATLEALAAAAAWLRDGASDFVKETTYSRRTFTPGDFGKLITDLADGIQSLTVSGVSLEKFAEGVREEQRLHDIDAMNQTIELVCKNHRIPFPAEKYPCINFDKLAKHVVEELRQPITDKSICSVGHVKANLTEKEDGRWNTMLSEWVPICIACQGERERRER